MVSNQQQRASQRLSSGFRINTGSDDAAGLAISEGMRAQIRGLNQASRNAQDGISVLQTADGYLDTLSEMTNRMRELAVQGANDTYSEDQRQILINEMELIAEEMDRMLDHATFNSSQLFRNASGDYADSLLGDPAGFFLQVGPDTDHAISVNVATDLALISARLDGDLDTIHAFDNQGGHQNFTNGIDILNTLHQDINDLRAALGANMNRLEFTIENVDLAAENMSASESRIRDADMGAEMMRLTQANVLQQAATAMLAQGNQAPQSILQLLG